jgi:hopanoid biosynthesis associated protein HpnK
VTADDFGFSHGVNQAILRAHREGVVTSTSLMVTGDAAEEAVALARENPSLAVGLHLVVVSGRAALPAAEIPALVDAQGLFPVGPVASGLRYQLRSNARAQLRREIRAQLLRFRETGLPLSHVDGHLHMHLHPVVLSCLVELADEFEIPAIRLPHEELSWNLSFERRSGVRKALWAWIFARLRRHGERLLGAAGIGFSDRVYGLLQTGRMTEGYWLDLLPRLSASSVEIYCHPDASLADEPRNGPPGAGASELAAVLSPRVREAIAKAGYALAAAHPAVAAPAGSSERPALSASAFSTRAEERPS